MTGAAGAFINDPMTRTNYCLALLLAMLLAAPAQAQQQLAQQKKDAPPAQGAVPTKPAAAPATTPAKTPAAAPAPAAGKVYEDWGIYCEAQADKSEKCFAAQYQFVTDSGQRLINVNVGFFGPRNEATVVVFLPLGIDLAAGAAIKFDPGPRVPLGIVTCVPEGCRATAALDAAALKAMREAKAITVGFRPFASEQTMNLAISVKGLAQAFAALK
jgi:invasion protein IalB